jgi:hypothetical protein
MRSALEAGPRPLGGGLGLTWLGMRICGVWAPKTRPCQRVGRKVVVLGVCADVRGQFTLSALPLNCLPVPLQTLVARIFSSQNHEPSRVHTTG